MSAPARASWLLPGVSWDFPLAAARLFQLLPLRLHLWRCASTWAWRVVNDDTGPWGTAWPVLGGSWLVGPGAGVLAAVVNMKDPVSDEVSQGVACYSFLASHQDGRFWNTCSMGTLGMRMLRSRWDVYTLLLPEPSAATDPGADA